MSKLPDYLIILHKLNKLRGSGKRRQTMGCTSLDNDVSTTLPRDDVVACLWPARDLALLQELSLFSTNKNKLRNLRVFRPTSHTTEH